MIEAAEADGRLTKNGSVVEYTGGSTGVSLSLVCAVKGHPLHIVSSDAFSPEKLDHMQILGAHLQIVPSESGGMTERLTRDMIEAARIIAEKTGSFWTDQLNNKDQLLAYHKMAEEIWSQTQEQIDGFIQSVGTAAPIRDKRIDLCLTIGHTDIQAPLGSEVRDGIGESGEERRNRGPRQIAKAFRH